jgi:hypothetical protein
MTSKAPHTPYTAQAHMDLPPARSSGRATRLRPVARWSLAIGLAAAATGMAHASTPQEKIECTQAPRTQWMSEAQARKLFKADTYALVKFKISKGNCHEFYAVDHQGGVVEAYMHPVTGAQVRITRIPAPVQNQTPIQGVKP